MIYCPYFCYVLDAVISQLVIGLSAWLLVSTVTGKVKEKKSWHFSAENYVFYLTIYCLAYQSCRDIVYRLAKSI